MAELEQQVIEVVNQPGRIGVIATADSNGQANLAYFGSARVLPDGNVILALGDNRTLDNLENNPKAVFLAVKESPVTFATPGWRLYLKVLKIHKEGEVLDSLRREIAEKAGAKVAATIIAAVLFDITEVRPLLG